MYTRIPRTQPFRTPALDFLAPCLARPSRRPLRRLRQSTHRRCVSSEAADAPAPTTPSPPRIAALSPEQREYLDGALRVNQAGELAATRIYAAQTPPLVRAHPNLRATMQHMAAQEADHLATFDALLTRHRVRPTALAPVWSVAATALGWSTALLGREAAMACTEAVETAIGGHYNDQVRELLRWKREAEARGEELGEELEGLLETVRRTRDEELEHLDIAVEQDAKEARPYELLTTVIREGCKGAIWLTSRI